MPGRSKRLTSLLRSACPAGVAVLLLACLVGCGGAAKSLRDERPMDEVSVLRKQMAERLVKKSRYDQAVPYLTQLLAKYPQDSRLHLMLGIVLREKETYAAAEQELLRSIELDSNNPEAYAALGILKNKLRRHKEAEALHRKAVEQAPKDARFHNNLGFCLFLMERYEEAEAAVLEAIHLDPGLRCAFNNLGFVIGLQDRPEEALKAFSKAGSQAMALTNMGTVQELLGKPTAARRYYEKALRHKSGYPPALENLRALDPQTYPSPERTEMNAAERAPSSGTDSPAVRGGAAGHDDQDLAKPAHDSTRAPASTTDAPSDKETR